ncbi:hypothetical protein ASC97_04260 [Rhizobium sp. Root1203]|uniref:hypothetical protein n=1 Tax=Rhizobium sp. Root1203 TaxID=1736427 RepID=UPI00070DF60D|nr:hypothetical protein [Rhizobium sp. Root1203]KQV27597.1 hypothetical protein ASC97_04260 [Rhizobium sp. Root1203]
MVDWEAARAFTFEACAEVFDYTLCRLQPRRRGLTANHVAGDDPSRLAFEFKGTIDLEPPSDRIPRHFSVDTGVKSGTVSYDAVLTALVTSWPYQPDRNDYVVDVAAGVTWTIVAKEQDGTARPAWYLSRA